MRCSVPYLVFLLFVTSGCLPQTPFVEAQWFGGKKNDDDICQLYLAPSPIFDNYLGVYTSKPLSQGSNIDGVTDVVVPLVEDYDPIWSHNDWSHMTSSVEWEGRLMRSLLIGVGSASAVSQNKNVYNVVPAAGSTQFGDSAGLHRGRDAGTGSFAYQRMQYKVTASIPAGGQLILNTLEHSSNGLTESDRKQLAATIEHTRQMIKDQTPEVVVEDLIRFIRSTLDPPQKDYFPANMDQLKRADNKGIDKAWKTEDLKVDLQYLKNNGACLDGIKVGTSNIAQAGRGAFARRAMEAEEVVTPVPVIPVLRHDLVLHFDTESNKVEYQLLLNYCIGDEMSSALLCPYGSLFPYVNHGGPDDSNVKLQWAQKVKSTHESWSEFSTVELLDHPTAGLVLELVATKPIKAGDEILLNYGEEWMAAWKDHETNWTVPADSASYKSASELNRDPSSSSLRTLKEQETEPYNDQVYIGIRYAYDPNAKPDSEEVVVNNDDGDATSGGKNHTIQLFRYSKSSQKSTRAIVRPVLVLERESSAFGDDLYTIELHNPHDVRDDQRIPIGINDDNSLSWHIKGVPRSALFFVDGLFSTDIHQPYVFREEIGAPEGLYPETWLDFLHDEHGDGFGDAGDDENNEPDL